MCLPIVRDPFGRGSRNPLCTKRTYLPLQAGFDHNRQVVSTRNLMQENASSISVAEGGVGKVRDVFFRMYTTRETFTLCLQQT